MFRHVHALAHRTPVQPRSGMFRLVLTMITLALMLGGLGIMPAAAVDSPPTIDQIAVEQRLALQLLDRTGPAPNLADEADPPTELVPGQRAAIIISFKNTSAQPVVLGYSWSIDQIDDPSSTPQNNVVPISSDPRSLETFPLRPGETRRFEQPIPPAASEVLSDELTLDPRDLVLVSTVDYCFADRITATGCPDPNQAPDVSARSQLRIPLRRADLGDAPDSTNHFAGASMTAYPTSPPTMANYPTVFDPATGTPSGPRHANPRPFHLGERVSLEATIDMGPDQDPLYNIIPLADDPDNERFDDGINPSQLVFVNCRPSALLSRVFMNPVYQDVLLEAGIETAYLNVWVDGSRDGDWDDATRCENASGNESAVAVEHIVIDQPVDIAALNPGVNVLPVVTGRVPWPEAFSERPAWLRVTLSLERSTKTLQTDNGLAYGDGRGNYDAQNTPVPFRSGETEDYLINRGNDGEADVTISKWGRILPPDPNAPDETRVAWVIEYRNSGDVAAREVVIRDRLADGLNINDLLINVGSRPLLFPRADGDALVFSVGLLEAGRSGRIALVTKLPEDAAPGFELVNQATISAANDSDPSNNQATARARLSLLTPRIALPGNGTTCSPDVTFAGRAVPGATVKLFNAAEELLATTTANLTGRWQAEVVLPAGRNDVYAVAVFDNATSEPSPLMSVFVDPDLPYDPLSMRFIEQDNLHAFRPVDEQGRTDDGGWVVTLKASTTYTFTVRSCCAQPDARLSLNIQGRPGLELTDPDGDGLYSGSFTTGDADQSLSFELVIICDGVRYVSGGRITTIAQGRVFDAQTQEPLEGAVVTLLECFNEAICLPSFFSGQNPQITGEDGAYSFFVAPGDYQLFVVRPGYYPLRTRIFRVEDGAVRLNIAMTPVTTGRPTHRVAIDESGFETSTLYVRPGAVVEFLNVDIWEHAIVSPRDAASGLPGGPRLSQTGDAVDSGLLSPGESYTLRFAGSPDGPLTYTITDGEVGLNTLTVIVDPAAPPTEDGYVVTLPMIIR